MIRFKCEFCGAKLQVLDKFRGRSGTCPNCGQVMVIPAQTVEDENDTWEGHETIQISAPFDLKGDALGMSLREFKRKYRREIGGGHRLAPFCSDETSTDEDSALLQEPWHKAAGIVTARPTYPHEEQTGGGTQTIAGVKAKLLVYFFIDGELFQIVARLPASGYLKIRESFLVKYGEPERKGIQKIHGKKWEFLRWSNGASEIILRQCVVDEKTCGLFFIHGQLNGEAKRRAPRTARDDI